MKLEQQETTTLKYSLPNLGGNDEFNAGFKKQNNARKLKAAEKLWDENKSAAAISVYAHVFGSLRKREPESVQTFNVGIELVDKLISINRTAHAAKLLTVLRSLVPDSSAEDLYKKSQIRSRYADLHQQESDPRRASRNAKASLRQLQQSGVIDDNLDVRARRHLMTRAFASGSASEANEHFRALSDILEFGDIEVETRASLIYQLTIIHADSGNPVEVERGIAMAKELREAQPDNPELQLYLGPMLDGQIHLRAPDPDEDSSSSITSATICFLEAAKLAVEYSNKEAGSGSTPSSRLNAELRSIYMRGFFTPMQMLTELFANDQGDNRSSTVFLMNSIQPVMQSVGYRNEENPQFIMQVYSAIGSCCESIGDTVGAMSAYVDAVKFMEIRESGVRAAGIPVVKKLIKLLSDNNRYQEAFGVVVNAIQKIVPCLETEQERNLELSNLNYLAAQVLDGYEEREQAIDYALKAVQYAEAVDSTDQGNSIYAKDGGAVFQALGLAVECALEEYYSIAREGKSYAPDYDYEAHQEYLDRIQPSKERAEELIEAFYKRFTSRSTTDPYFRISAVNRLAAFALNHEQPERTLDLVDSEISRVKAQIKANRGSGKEKSQMRLGLAHLAETASQAHRVLAQQETSGPFADAEHEQEVKKYQALRDRSFKKLEDDGVRIAGADLKRIEYLIQRNEFPKAVSDLKTYRDGIVEGPKAITNFGERAEELLIVSELYEKCDKPEDALTAYMEAFQILEANFLLTPETEASHRIRLAELSLEADFFTQVEPILSTVLKIDVSEGIRDYASDLIAISAGLVCNPGDYLERLHQMAKFPELDQQINQGGSYSLQTRLLASRALLKNYEAAGDFRRAIKFAEELCERLNAHDCDHEILVEWYSHAARLNLSAGYSERAESIAVEALNSFENRSPVSSSSGIELTSILLLARIDRLNFEDCHRYLNTLFDGVYKTMADITDSSLIFAYRAKARLYKESGSLLVAEEYYEKAIKVLSTMNLTDQIEHMDTYAEALECSYLLGDQAFIEERLERFEGIVEAQILQEKHPSVLRFRSWECLTRAAYYYQDSEVSDSDRDEVEDLLASFDRSLRFEASPYLAGNLPLILNLNRLRTLDIIGEEKEIMLASLSQDIGSGSSSPSCNNIVASLKIARARLYVSMLKESPEFAEDALIELQEAEEQLKSAHGKSTTSSVMYGSIHAQRIKGALVNVLPVVSRSGHHKDIRSFEDAVSQYQKDLERAKKRNVDMMIRNHGMSAVGAGSAIERIF